MIRKRHAKIEKKSELTIAKEKGAIVLTTLADKIASLRKPLNQKQREFVAKKIVKVATMLNVAENNAKVSEDTSDENDEAAEGINNAVKKIFQRKTDYNKLKTKKVKDIITKSGPEILNMKIQEFFEMIANM